MSPASAVSSSASPPRLRAFSSTTSALLKLPLFAVARLTLSKSFVASSSVAVISAPSAVSVVAPLTVSAPLCVMLPPAVSWAVAVVSIPATVKPSVSTYEMAPPAAASSAALRLRSWIESALLPPSVSAMSDPVSFRVVTTRSTTDKAPLWSTASSLTRSRVPTVPASRVNAPVFST